MFNSERTLESKIQEYLCIRKTFRILEIIGIVGLIFAAFMEEKKDGTLVILVISGILLCIAFFEGEIAIYRSGVKFLIKTFESSLEDDLKKYSEFKDEIEMMWEEFISKMSDFNSPEETRELMIKEEIGFGWMSRRIKYFKSECDIAKQKLKELEQKRRLVNY